MIPLKNYIIPYEERFLNIVNNPSKYSLMVVDNVGLWVGHDKGQKPTESEVRRCLIGVSTHRWYVQAKDLQEALLKFYELPATKCGTKHRAVTIADSKHNPIIEYIGCKWLRNDEKRGCVACAYFEEPNFKEGYTACILDGCDEPPSKCPIDEQKQKHKWRDEVVQIGGVWVRQYTKKCAPVDEIINPIRPRKRHVAP